MGRYARTIAVLAAAALALAACGYGHPDPGAAGAGGTTISLLVPSYGDATRAEWQGIIKDFQVADPTVRVTLEVQSWDAINDVVRTRIQAGQAPDVLNLDAFAAFAQEGLLRRADEAASPSTIADFQDGFRANASLGGVQYGLPLIASTRTLFYNKDLFAKAGIARPPRTWDELLADARRISALGGGVYGYGMPLGGEEAQAETSIWTFGAGGNWTDGRRITVDTPANLDGVRFARRMAAEGATQPNPGATDRTPLLNVFIQGKLGMVEGLPPTIGQIRAKNPELRWGTAPTPTKDGKPVTLGVADHLMVFRHDDPARLAAARAFVDFAFKPEVYARLVGPEGFLPTTKSGSRQLADKPELRDFLASLPRARFYPSTNQAWPATQGAIQRLVGQVTQGSDPAKVLRQIQAKADAAAAG